MDEPLAEICICAGPPKFSCGKCRRKRYCSKDCQRRDWPLHRRQCGNDALIETVLENEPSNLSLVHEHIAQMMTPPWQKYLTVVYDALRRRLHDEGLAENPDAYLVSWLQISNNERRDESARVVDVAYVYLAQEPTRLFMHVSAERGESDRDGEVRADEGKRGRDGEVRVDCAADGVEWNGADEGKRGVDWNDTGLAIIDRSCTVFETAPGTPMKALLYPLRLRQETPVAIVDWMLRA